MHANYTRLSIVTMGRANFSAQNNHCTVDKCYMISSLPLLHFWQVFFSTLYCCYSLGFMNCTWLIDNAVISFRCIPVELRLAVTLWVLATGSGYRSVAHLFGIANSTCCEIFKETCSVIVTVLLPRYIRMPNNERLDEIIEGFETKFGFPNCGGAIDATHIPITAPQHRLPQLERVLFNCGAGGV